MLTKQKADPMQKYVPIVMQWIEEAFDMTAIQVEDFSVFPAGKLIRDENGHTMVVFYDVWTDQVKYTFPKK
ncbi:hypothetical protein V2J23_00870 [Geobacillus thermoleovorans]|uniref:Uncharacterized protein n=1 Tax=Geobacillus thermopakistaniensis (strain MAS1) TaxID=1408282 RepID=A0A7U9J7M7_GEOTM|nr:hypothetical protein [Geobacillus sp. MAS1]ESU70479.1 hypothetical protein T260_18280 [Geobacillus sp. MAS1]